MYNYEQSYRWGALVVINSYCLATSHTICTEDNIIVIIVVFLLLLLLLYYYYYTLVCE